MGPIAWCRTCRPVGRHDSVSWTSADVRIIAGSLKGRTIHAPKGSSVRPTTDGLRERLFNILGDLVAGARFLDACAGTGSVGLEALSRGAAAAVFVEQDRRAAEVLAENIRACGVDDRATIVRTAMAAARGVSDLSGMDIVFLDPPYEMDGLDQMLEHAAAVVRPGGLVVLERSRRRTEPVTPPALRLTRVVTAGDSVLAFYAADGAF
jgi:16S rRNA (guanine966-N2)-methyltransferase